MSKTNPAGPRPAATLPVDDACVLPYIAAFHRLRAKADEGRGLTLEEGRLLASLLSMFESRQVADGRLVRKPIKLLLDKPARFVAGERVWEGTVREANLHHLSLEFATPPPAEIPGEVQIEGVGDTRWRFDGRITRAGHGGRTVVELGLPLGQIGRAHV